MQVIPERWKIQIASSQICFTIPRYLKIDWARQLPGDVISHIRTRMDLVKENIQRSVKASSGEIDRAKLQQCYDELMRDVKWGGKKEVYAALKREFFPWVASDPEHVGREVLRQLKKYGIKLIGNKSA
jgi:predicted RND superfamily exporter protein